MTRIHPTLMVVLLVLPAGCFSGGEGGTTSTSVTTGNLPLNTTVLNATDVPPAELPTWNVSDAWHLTLTSSGGEEEAFLAVTEVDSSGYLVGTNSQELAYKEALEDVGFLGRIRAEDLSGVDEGEPVKFFDFPLAHNKTWTTTWEGQELTMVVHGDPQISTPLGPKPGFVINGTTAANQRLLSYTYVPEFKWWTQFNFTGTGAYSFRVEMFHPNWTGHVMEPKVDILLEMVDQGAGGTGTFTVTADHGDLALVIHDAGTAYVRSLVVKKPDGTEYTTQHGPTGYGTAPRHKMERIPPEVGSWTVESSALTVGGSMHLMVQGITYVETPVSPPLG